MVKDNVAKSSVNSRAIARMPGFPHPVGMTTKAMSKGFSSKSLDKLGSAPL